MISKTNFIKALSSLAIAAVLGACNSSSNDANVETGKVDNTKSPATKEQNSKAKEVFKTIPEPVETTKLLKDVGAKYNASYLNPIENASKYSSVKSKAINLGIYGSDLSFISLYDQTQESMLYLKCTNTLSSSLGISGAFDEKTTSRIQDNMDKKDSLLAIISQAFWNTDSYLTKNGQPGVSSLVVAGGWIEGLYIANEIAKATKGQEKNGEIISRIGDQKASLAKLIDLLDAYKGENGGVDEVVKKFNDLKKTFDANTGESGAKLTDEQFKAIADKTAELRNSFIKP